MNRLVELLTRLMEASADLPDPEVEPEVVLAAAEHMMEMRRLAFDELKLTLEAGAAVDADVRKAASQLQGVDSAWAARMQAAMNTLATRMVGARRLKASLYAQRQGKHAAIQV